MHWQQCWWSVWNIWSWWKWKHQSYIQSYNQIYISLDFVKKILGDPVPWTTLLGGRLDWGVLGDIWLHLFSIIDLLEIFRRKFVVDFFTANTKLLSNFIFVNSNIGTSKWFCVWNANITITDMQFVIIDLFYIYTYEHKKILIESFLMWIVWHRIPSTLVIWDVSIFEHWYMFLMNLIKHFGWRTSRAGWD